MANRADTSLGIGGGKFRSTVWDCLQNLQGADEGASRAAFDQIVTWYWRPIYRCIRVGWNKTNDEAKDLTQSFFLTMLRRDALAKADPSRGKFRTFLKTALRNFLANDHRSSLTTKRGGEHSILPADFQEDPPDLALPAGSSPEEILDREWARRTFERALDRLRDSLQGEDAVRFRIFEASLYRAPGEPEPTHEDLGARFSKSKGEIKRILQDVRVRLRGILVEEIRMYATTQAEAEEELEFLKSLWG